MKAGNTLRFMASIRRKEDAPEFGFGNSTNNAHQRALNPDGTANIARIGEKKFNPINIYHALVTMTWRKFFFIAFISYAMVNLFFATIYYLVDPNGLSGMIYTTEGQKFEEIFFFSAQSLTTVGYGRLNPTGTFNSSLAAIESFIGLLGFALATGLLYGKFSRPTAKLLYSKNILIAPYSNPRVSDQAKTALMFRITNERSNQLIEVESQILFSYNEEVNGKILRRFQRLKLEVEKISFLAMSWTIVHPIDDESPLKGLTNDDFESVDAEFLINIKAIDDTYVQQVYARSSYKWNDTIWDAKFVSIITQDEDGRTAIDLRKISSYELVNNQSV